VRVFALHPFRLCHITLPLIPEALPQTCRTVTGSAGLTLIPGRPGHPSPASGSLFSSTRMGGGSTVPQDCPSPQGCPPFLAWEGSSGPRTGSACRR
jgi:hypothetical protein